MKSTVSGKKNVNVKTANLLVAAIMAGAVLVVPALAENENLEPTLDRINTKSNTLVLDSERSTYPLLTEAPVGSDYVSVKINSTTYYFTPDTTTYPLADWQNLANTGSVALTTVDNGTKPVFSHNDTNYYYNPDQLPTSSYGIVESTSTDYNFSKITETGETKYYKINLKSTADDKVYKIEKTDDASLKTFSIPAKSGDTPTEDMYSVTINEGNLETDWIKWSKEGSESNKVTINLPNSTKTTTLYYTDKLSRSPHTRYNNNLPTGQNIGTASSGLLFKNLATVAVNNTKNWGKDIYADFISNKAATGTAINNTGAIGNITGDFISNIATSDSAGAIYNSGTINNIKGDFILNESQVDKGGAICNYIGSINSIEGNFISNSGKKGGAIFNATYGGNPSIGNITGDFIGNSAADNGGAIENLAVGSTANVYMGNITGDFIANTSGGNGGAIDNYVQDDGKIVIDNITGDFIGNSATGNGGAISNDGTIGNITGDFISNSANWGGAIYNSYDSTIGNITGDFIGNYAQAQGGNARGGAIYNYGTINNITGDFISNSSNSGGAIFNGGTIGNITGDFIGNSGGAIASDFEGIIGNITGDFIGNSGSRAIIADQGSTTGNITGDFIGNSCGAIWMYDNSIGDITGNFIENYTSGSENARGGAIYSEAAVIGAIIGNIKGDFIGNYAQAQGGNAQGGAIWVNAYEADISTGNITGNFTGNYAQAQGGNAQGGAIWVNAYEADISTGNITGNFTGNYAKATSSDAQGGAIYNNGLSATIGDIEGDITSNHAEGVKLAQGGAIYNENGQIGNIKGNIDGNYVNSSTKRAYGGAIYNKSGSIGDIEGDITNNYAVHSAADTYARGGAIYNEGGTIGNITGNITSNHSTSTTNGAYAGAIMNFTSGEIGDITGDITGNYIESKGVSYGGAVLNWNSEIGNITGKISNNHIVTTSDGCGGAIWNAGATMGNISGDEIKDNYVSSGYLAQGGAIYNENSSIGDITSDFSGNYAVSNGTTPVSGELYYARGGAIYNQATGSDLSIGKIDANFTNNRVESHLDEANGGAIYNAGHISEITGDFTNNSATLLSVSAADKSASGGAIFNAIGGVIDYISGNFTGNKTTAANDESYGGAIRNQGTITYLTGNFRDNVAGGHKARGGAIWNWGGYVDIFTNNNDIEFKGNLADTAGGAILNQGEGSSMGLYAQEGRTINFVGKSNDNGVYVDDENADTFVNTGILNINGEHTIGTETTNYTGTVNLVDLDNLGTSYGETNIGGGVVNVKRTFKQHDLNLNAGTLKLGDGGTVNGTFTSAAGAKVVLSGNEKIDTLSVNDFNDTLNNFSVDFDTINKTIDKIDLTTGSGTIKLTDIVMLNDDENFTSTKINYLTGDLSSIIDETPSMNYYIPDIPYRYVFERSENKGEFDVSREFLELWEAVAAEDLPNPYTYKISSDTYDINNGTTGIGSLAGGEGKVFTIEGNGNTVINGKGRPGITVNEGQTLTITDTTMSNFKNSASGVNGSALINNGTVVSITGATKDDRLVAFTGNSSKATSSDAKGGAVYNYGSSAIIGDITGDITNNHAEAQKLAQGGAIYNENGQIGNIKGNIDGNYVNSSTKRAYGGAIYNKSGSIGNIEGDITNNYAVHSATDTYARGGAIYNEGGKIGNITGNISSNYSTSTTDGGYAGAIMNFTSGEIGDITGDITENYVDTKGTSYGGAVLNWNSKIGNITGKISNNHIVTTSDGCGGAVWNAGATMGNISGDEIKDNYISSNYLALGGAIYNETSSIGDITSDFSGNYAISNGTTYESEQEYYARGGAINNQALDGDSSIGKINANFTNNHVDSKLAEAQGGAIYNNATGDFKATIGDITGNFVDNYVYDGSGTNGQGGAIYNTGVGATISITTNGADLEFKGNMADEGGAIYNTEGASIGLYAEDGKSISFRGVKNDGGEYVENEKADTIHNNSALYINGEHTVGDVTKNYTGTVNLAKVNGTGDTFIYAGKVVSNGGFEQNSLTVMDDALLEIGASNLKVTEPVQNSGTIDLKTGTLTSNISGGTVNVIKDQSVGIADGKALSNLNLVENSTLNQLNDAYDTITIGTFNADESSKNNHLTFDVGNDNNDKIAIIDSASGTLDLTGINIKDVDPAVGLTATKIGLFTDDGDKSGLTIKQAIVATSGDSFYYTFTQNETNKGDIDIVKYVVPEAPWTIQQVIAADTYATIPPKIVKVNLYQLRDDITLDSDLGTLTRYDGDATRELTINGFNKTLDGVNQYAGVVVNADDTLSFRNITMTNFTATNGGAINNTNGTINITDSNFVGNKAANAGGVISNTGENGVVTITALHNDVNFDGNYVTGENPYGGAIYNDENGTVNLLASEGMKIDFKGISSEVSAKNVDGIYNAGSLNINGDGEGSTYLGTVNLQSVAGEGSTNVYGGTVNVNANFAQNSVLNDAKLNFVNGTVEIGTLSGSGETNMTGAEPINIGTVSGSGTTTISGTGAVDIGIVSTSGTTTISGTGAVDIGTVSSSGTTNITGMGTAVIDNISGSGSTTISGERVATIGAVSDSVTANISGTGAVNIGAVSDSVTTNISGSGTVDIGTVSGSVTTYQSGNAHTTVGTMSGTGTTTVNDGEFVVSGDAVQSTMSVDNAATLNLGGNVATTDGITNNGTLNLTGGASKDTPASIASNINGTGTTNVSGHSDISGYDVVNNVNVLTDASLKISADIIASDKANIANNEGTVILNGGTLDSTFSLPGNAEIEVGSEVNADIASFNGENAGTLTNYGTFNMSGDIVKDIAGNGITVLASAQDTVNVEGNHTIEGTLNANDKTINLMSTPDVEYNTLNVGYIEGNANLNIDVNMVNSSTDRSVATASDKINLTQGSQTGAVLNLTDITAYGLTDVVPKYGTEVYDDFVTYVTTSGSGTLDNVTFKLMGYEKGDDNAKYVVAVQDEQGKPAREYKYTLGNLGKLNVEAKDTTLTLEQFVDGSTNTDVQTYELAFNYVPEGDVIGTTALGTSPEVAQRTSPLTLKLINGSEVNAKEGENVEGITVDNGIEFTVQGVSSPESTPATQGKMSGFNTALKVNKGEGNILNVIDMVLTDNTTDIENNGTLNLGGSKNIIDTIKGAGSTNIIGGVTVVNDELTQNDVLLNPDTELIANADILNIKNGIVNEDATVVLTGGKLKTDINGKKGGVVNINDSEVTNEATIANDAVVVRSKLTNNNVVDVKNLDNTGVVTNNGSIVADKISNYDGTVNATFGSDIQGDLTGGTFNSNDANSFTGTLRPKNLNFNDGTLYMDGNLSAKNTNANGGNLNMSNGTFGEANVGNIALNKDMGILMDADIISGSIDRIAAESVSGAGKINMTLNIPSRIDKILTQSNITVNPISNEPGEVRSALANAIQHESQKIVTPIYNYQSKFDNQTGLMSFSAGGNDYDGFNSAVMATPVAAQMGGFLNLVNSYDDAFANMDMTMLMTKAERTAMKQRNKYAAADGADLVTFSPNQFPEENAGVWFRPYASFEKVDLNHGPEVGNNSYGGLVGADSKLIELKNGWDAVFTGYAGYNGSHQHYEGNSIWQNGGQLGATAVFYKGDFFTGLTATTGASVGDANTMYGKEDFTMLMAGVASKTGYNWELFNSKFIVQPNWLMSYSFINTFDHHNAAGVNIEAEPLHAIQLVPGLKLIGNLPHGWQPYVGVQMVWNILDKTRYTANQVSLPDTSIDPYVQYGLGVQKRWGEKFTGYGQVMFRNGGRNGISLSGGFRWALGKNPQKMGKTEGVKKSSERNINISVK